MIQKQTQNYQWIDSYSQYLIFSIQMEEQQGDVRIPSDEEAERSYRFFLEMQKKYFGDWSSKQTKISASQRKIVENKEIIQKQQTIAPEPQKKKRKNQFQIDQRLLKKQSSSFFEKHPNKNLRQYSQKYFECLQSIRENDLSAYKEYESLIQSQQKAQKDKLKKDPNREVSHETKSKRVKKRQIYMPSVVKTIQKPYLMKKNDKNLEQMSTSNNEKPAIIDFQIKKTELRIKSLKQQLTLLQIQLSNKNISQKEQKFLTTQKINTTKKIQYLQKMAVKKKQDSIESQKKSYNNKIKIVEQPYRNKPKTEYQKYLKQENDKKARRERLLRQEELKFQRQKQFEDKIKNTGNPIQAIFQLQAEMSRKGKQMIKNLQKQAEKTHKSHRKSKRQSISSKQKQIKIQHNEKTQKERINRSQQNQFSSEEHSTSNQELPQWKKELMTVTRYDPNSQKYRRRDRQAIYQSGFSRIEKEDKFSRKMALKEEKQAKAQGQIEDV